MKKIISFILFSTCSIAIAQPPLPTKNITLFESEISASQALVMVNQACGTAIAQDILVRPDNKVSLAFDNIPCEAVIKLILQIDQGLV